jgi:glycosyltransferase involved in cell wall biosynthesis
MEPTGDSRKDLGAQRSRHLTAIVVTYQRPSALVATLESLECQTRPVDAILVVDNDPDGSAEHIAAERSLDYVRACENLGPAGGISLGMECVLPHRVDDDLVVLVDDDDPVVDTRAFEALVQLLEATERTGERCAGVGGAGARYRRSRGDFERVPDAALHGPVLVDYIGGNQTPVYTIEAIRKAGCFDPRFFFGFDDAEFGLRLRSAGWTLRVAGDRWLSQRRQAGRLGISARPTSAVAPPAWRQYYSTRNSVHLARRYGTRRAMLETVGRGLFVTPVRRLGQRSASVAWASIRGSLDGVRGVHGRTVEPTPKPPSAASE